MTRIAVGMLGLSLVLLAPGVVSAQSYPSKPIRMWTAPAGGGNDFFGRHIAQAISGPLGQPVIIENRTSLEASEIVAKSPPDGYNLVYGGTGLMYTPLVLKTSYDPVKDFSPITLTATNPSILVVHPLLPVKTVKELIALAKARPGELNYGAGLVGSLSQLGAELFKSMTGTKIVGITFKGSGPAIVSLMGGEVQLSFADLGSALTHVKSGRLKALAVTSTAPTALVPGVPTVAASGVPGYEVVGLDGIWAPAGTPAAIINRLNQEIVRVLNTPETKEKYFAAGADVTSSTPEQAASRIKTDIATMAKLIKDAGIKVD